MAPSLPRRKRIRLDAEVYRNPGVICSITVALCDRRPRFSNVGLAASAVGILRSQALATGIAVYGFCVMPDHVHLVLSPSVDCDLITFVAQYKNLLQREAWSQGVKGRIWQRSFWDHFLRPEEQVESTVEYVLNNPVRRGMVSDWREYPFCGSLVLDL